MFSLLLGLCLCICVVSAQKTGMRGGAQSAFFMQDIKHAGCLKGDTYGRCSIDTLWYVTGKPGSYQIHKRPSDWDFLASSDDTADICLHRTDCLGTSNSSLGLGACDHCGASKWNIVGDASTGFVLTEGENKNCLLDQTDKAALVNCDTGYSAFELKFATKADLALLSSAGARLVSAASEGDSNAVESLLGEGVDVNSQDWDKSTPLLAAAAQGHLKLVQRFIALGADANAVDRDNVTALHLASFGGYAEVVAYLLPFMTDLNAQALSGVSAIWLAASEGHGDIVALLLAKGATLTSSRSDGIDAVMVASEGGYSAIVGQLLSAGGAATSADQDGLTALMSATESGDVTTVRLLVEAGADVSFMSQSGFNALLIASSRGHQDIVRYLVESAGASVQPEHPQDITPLMFAAAGGFEEIVAYLLEKDARSELVNAQHSLGFSAVAEAAMAGHSVVIQQLLEAGADPFLVDKEGATLLMLAAAGGFVEACRVLHAAGVSVNAASKSGATALLFAASAGHTEATQLLLELGADTNQAVEANEDYMQQIALDIAAGKEGVEPHTNGVTPLMLAALAGHADVVRLLVEQGKASVVSIDDEQMTALANAAKRKHYDLCMYLLQHGADPNVTYIDEPTQDATEATQHNLLADAVTEGNTDLALLLLEKGADTSYTDAEGVTPLTAAAFQGQAAVVRALLDHGAAVTASSHEGVDALLAAASEGHTEIISMLMSTGQANVNVQDHDGTTSLMAAAVRGYKDTVALLLKHGPDVNRQNTDGHTALMFAYNGKHQVQMLLNKYRDYLSAEEGLAAVETTSARESMDIIDEALKTHVEITQLLLEHGADASIQDKEGHVAADFDYHSHKKGHGDEALGHTEEDTEL